MKTRFVVIAVAGLLAQASLPSGALVQQPLDGTWSFRLVQGANSAEPAAPGNDCEWADIKVPGNWEMQGFGEPIYGGDKQKNEYGIYRRSFEVPDDWADKDVFLRTDGVQFGYRLYLDGAYVGEWTSSFNRKEWNITGAIGASRPTEPNATIPLSRIDVQSSPSEAPPRTT